MENNIQINYEEIYQRVLNKINEDNYKLLKYLHNYLFYYDRCINKEMIDDLLKYDLDEEYAFSLYNNELTRFHIKKDDTVVVLSGDDKGVQGEVIAVSPEEGKVIVKGVNIIHKHVKPRRQGETGGIIDAEGAIYASNVALYCSNCKQGVRVKHEIVDGKKVRVCAKCGKKFD